MKPTIIQTRKCSPKVVGAIVLTALCSTAFLSAIPLGILSAQTPKTTTQDPSTARTLHLAKEDFTIIDGDTIRVGKTYHRLQYYNTPELHRPKCSKELVLACKARDLLTASVSASTKIRLVQSGKQDIYQRELSTLYLDGVPTWRILIEADLANFYYSAKSRKRNWCVRP